MTPWNPFPFETPITSTRSFGLNSAATSTLSPTDGLSPPATRRNSLSRRVGGRFALAKCPCTALETPRAFPGSTSPSCTASYPSLAASRLVTTMHGPACSTVQGTVPPSWSNTCVMDTLRPINPSTTPASPSFLLERLDLDLHPGGKVELHERVHRLRGRLEDVEQPLVRADLELLPGLLVHVGRSIDGELVDDRRQGDRSRDARARPLGRRHDLAGRLVQDAVIVCLQADANLLVQHGPASCPSAFLKEPLGTAPFFAAGPAENLLQDLRHRAGADGAAAFADREAQSLVHRDRRDQFNEQVDVVSRHHHLHPRRQLRHPRHVRRPEIELRPVAVEERRVPSPLLLRQDVHLRLELRVRRDAPRLRHHLPPLHLFLLRPPQQQPDVVPRHPLVQQLLEHLHPGHHTLERRPDPHHLHLLAHLHLPLLHPPRHHRPPPRNRKHVLDRHQERPVHRPLRHRYVLVHRRHQLVDLLQRPLVPLHRLQRRYLHHRDLVPRKLVRLQKLPHLQLHQIQQLLVVHRVHLVQGHHDPRHPHLPRQQNVLPRLRHRPVRRRHHQDRPVHLRRTRDHVLHVVRVPRTVHVRVVPVLRLVLHVRRRDRDPPLPLLRSVVDRVERPHRHFRELLVQRHRDRRRQRRLPVIHVPDRPHVHVRLRPLEFLLGHLDPPLTAARSTRRPRSSSRAPWSAGGASAPCVIRKVEPTTGIEPVTPSLPRKCSTTEPRGPGNEAMERETGFEPATLSLEG